MEDCLKTILRRSAIELLRRQRRQSPIATRRHYHPPGENGIARLKARSPCNEVAGAKTMNESCKHIFSAFSKLHVVLPEECGVCFYCFVLFFFFCSIDLMLDSGTVGHHTKEAHTSEPNQIQQCESMCSTRSRHCLDARGSMRSQSPNMMPINGSTAWMQICS